MIKIRESNVLHISLTSPLGRYGGINSMNSVNVFRLKCSNHHFLVEILFVILYWWVGLISFLFFSANYASLSVGDVLNYKLCLFFTKAYLLLVFTHSNIYLVKEIPGV